MARTVFDCARVPGDTCSLQMIGEKSEVLPAAQQHLISAHNHPEGDQLTRNVTNALNQHAEPYDGWI
jgi:predicted small metal-binding protein